MPRFDRASWTLGHSLDAPPDVIVDTTVDDWMRFLRTPPADRDAARQGIVLHGAPQELERFGRLLAAFPEGVH